MFPNVFSYCTTFYKSPPEVNIMLLIFWFNIKHFNKTETLLKANYLGTQILVIWFYYLLQELNLISKWNGIRIKNKHYKKNNWKTGASPIEPFKETPIN
jgi:hypothetical protein